jgi:hypothetical protein
MDLHPSAIAASSASSPVSERSFAPFSARRILLTGGIGLILAGMLLGDLFAIFVLHQNAGRIGSNLSTAIHAVLAHNPAGAGSAFQNIGSLLENRGTKVDAHSHMIGFGYIALLLALLQPYVALAEKTRKSLAKVFVAGAVLLPVGVFLIHYIGLAYSPLSAIGWASIFADFGGFLVFIVCVFELAGLWRYLHAKNRSETRDALLADRSTPGRLLLSGGTLLVLVGFLFGAYYAATGLYQNEAKNSDLLLAMAAHSASGDSAAAMQAWAGYGELQAEEAVNVAAHAHVIEFGVLAILLAFFQPYVFFSERWKRIWANVLLVGSIALPFFVLMELRWGLVAGGFADAGGLLVIISLFAMLIGVWRYTGLLDSGAGERA